jgi:uncharacterized protein
MASPLHSWKSLVLLLLGTFLLSSAHAQLTPKDSVFVAENYVKREFYVPMRDGVKLFTAAYVPKDTIGKTYPILLNRTPYSISPYGPGKLKAAIGPSPLVAQEGYIFVYQDVRGKMMSEGEFEDMRPQLKDPKKDKKGIDESTDTYDAIDWLIKHLKNHNGKVGMWGISYPGFYAAVGLINAHPALMASSPQAPIADWFFDDFKHHGALFLPHTFNFMASFGYPRLQPTTLRPATFRHPTPDGYKFFMENIGPLSNVNLRYYNQNVKFWNDLVAHPDYDSFWEDRNLLPHLKNIHCAVLVVGGWYDAEDLYGPLKIYQAIEKNNPSAQNSLVMGPWGHGGWLRTDGTHMGNVFFGNNPQPSSYYRENIELKFFNYHLKGKGDGKLPEAYMFETGTNQWRQFASWPPSAETKQLFLHAGNRLSFDRPTASSSFSEFVSDPSHPVPFTEAITTAMTKEYMTDDQRFAAKRADVLIYQTDVLTTDMTLAGPINAMLQVATTGTDADWIVKLIDVYPDSASNNSYTNPTMKMGGYQQMVRSEVIRGRYRNSYAKPEPFTPDQVTQIKLELLDVLHTFKKGHRLMIQIQSTWFPLVDRNPQKYVPNIFLATEADFMKATHRVYHDQVNASFIQIGVLK